MSPTAIFLFIFFSTLVGGPQQEADAPVLWSGEPRAELTSELRRALDYPAAELSREVARVMLRLKTDRDFEGARAALSALHLRAAEQTAFDADFVLAVTRARVELEAQLGDAARARRVAGLPLPTRAEVRAALDPPHVVAAEGEWAETLITRARALAPADPVVRDGDAASQASGEAWLAERLSPDALAYLRKTCGTPARELVEFVTEQLFYNQPGSVRDLGVQASSALMLLVLEDLEFENPHSLEQDPFALLIRADRGTAANLALDWLDRGGAAWRWRILHWITEYRLLVEADAWLLYKNKERVLASQPRHPAWLEVLETLLRDDRLRGEALTALRGVPAWDGLTEGLQDALVELVDRDDAALSRRVLDTVHDEHGVPSAVRVHLAGMRSSHAGVRRECARRLAALPAPPRALLEYGADPDPVVRASVADSLDGRSVEGKYFSNGSLDERTVRRDVDFGARELTALESLLRDPVAEVRERARRALGSRDEISTSLHESAASSPVSEVRAQLAMNATAWYRDGSADSRGALAKLLADPEPAVRAAFFGGDLEHLGVRAQVQVVTTLAEDADLSVLDALDAWLQDTSEWKTDAFVAALPRRLSNPAAAFLPYGGGVAGWTELLRSCRKKMPGVQPPLVLLGAGLDQGIDELVADGLMHFWTLGGGGPLDDRSVLLRALEPEQRVALYDWCERSLLATESLAELVHEALEDLGDDEACRLALERPEPPGSWVWDAVDLGIDGGASDLTGLLATFFRDPTRRVSDRLRAAGMVDVLTSPADREYFLELVCGLDPAAHASDIEWLDNAVKGSSGANALLLAAIQDGRVASPVLRELAAGFDGGAPEADAAAVAILERWLGLGPRDRFVRAAIYHLGTSQKALEHADLLIAASRRVTHVSAAVEAMARNTDPRFLAPLGATLALGPKERLHRRRWASYVGTSLPKLEVLTIQALLRYPQTEASEQLRAGLLVADSEGRELILEALDSLERFSALERASTRRARVTRESALAELMDMLASEDAGVRIEAARSLAAFGALESLPRLIDLLQDEDERVRSAARESIDRLREPAPHVESPVEEGP